MRVTLDLDPAESDRPCGILTCDGEVEPLAFDGWLDLMRLLEVITTAARSADRSHPMSHEFDRRTLLRASATLGLSGAAAMAWSVPPAAAATITVRRSGPVRPLSPTFFGLNGNNLQESLQWDRGDLDSALASLRPGLLRYPGGTIGNYWAWRAGWFQPNGPWPAQTNGDTGQVITPFNNGLAPYAVGLQRSEAGALFVVNMLTVDGHLAKPIDNQRVIDEGVAFLQAAATAGIAVRRIELGNEFYLAGPSAGPNGSDYTTRFPTATAYAQHANDWVTAIRATFPAAQIAAVGTDATGNNAARREGWNAAVLGVFSGGNALTLHPYIPVTDASASPQSLLSLPYQRVQSLIATEFQQLTSRGLTGWVTEFNMVDRTPNLTFAGTWTHGLFVAAYAILLAQNPTITLIDLHNVVGDAAAGTLFDSTDGFRTPTPVTQFLGRTAMGSTYAMLLQATRTSTSGQPLAFAGGPVLAGGAPGLVGLDFTGGAQHHAVIVNLATTAVTLDLSTLFAGTFSWTRTRAAALTTRISGASSLSVTNGTSTGSLNVPAHSLVRIFR
jgi:hypothetical protein